MKNQLSPNSPEHFETAQAIAARLAQAEAARVRAELELQTARELNREILERMPSGVAWVAADGSIGYANREAARILGMTQKELTEAAVIALGNRTVHEDGSPYPVEDYPVVRCLATGQPQPLSTVGVKRPDGTTSWAMYSAVPLGDLEGGKLNGALVTFTDITERKAAEEHLRESEDRYRRLVENAPDAIIVHCDGEVRFGNAAAMRLCGAKTPGEMIGHHVLEFVHPTSREFVQERLHRVQYDRLETPLTEERLMRPDGQFVDVEVSSTPCIYEGEICSQTIIRNITQRKQAEAQIHRQTEIQQKVFEYLPLMVAVVDPAGIVRMTNRAYLELVGASHRGERLRDVMAEAHPNPEDFQRAIDNISYPPGTWTDLKTRIADGQIVETSWASIALSDGSRVRIGQDVRERKQAEWALRESEEKWRTLATNAPSLILTVDPVGTIQFSNRAFCDRTLEELVGAKIFELVPAARQVIAQALEYVFRTGMPASYEAAMTDGYGIQNWYTHRVGPLERDGRVVQALIIATDITRQKQAEAELMGANADLEHRVQLRTQELLRKNEELEREVQERRRAEVELQSNQRFLERMLNVHERERQLVAYEIHDTFVQDVIAALMFCESFVDPSPAGELKWHLFDQARVLLRRAIDEARRMISGLRPPIIDEQGIMAGIEFLASEFKQRGLDVEFVPAGDIPRMPSLLEGCVFRIAQEALNNMHRHSGVTRGLIELRCEAETLRLAVRDAGVGFDPRNLPEGRFGLQGMKERARLIGGQLTLESAPGLGTCVRLEMPIVLADDSER